MNMKRSNRASSPVRVAIARLGAIGLQIARTLDEGLEGYTLAAVSARDLDAAKHRLSFLSNPVPILPISELENEADIVVECAPAHLLHDVVDPFVRAGKKAIVLSCGALLENDGLIKTAQAAGGQIIVPSGALLGLDAVSAAAIGEIYSVEMITRKPVVGLLGAPHLLENNIDIADIREPLRVFKGSPRDAAKGFPANLNVAVALSLAGIGPDKTRLEIWADPDLKLNQHSIDVEADSARFRMHIENIPTENPKTGRITALSVIAALSRLHAPLRVGT